MRAFRILKEGRHFIDSKGGRMMGTILVLVILILVVALVVRGMIRDKKAGKSLQCGGDCKYCGGHCHQIDAEDGGKKNG